MPLLQKARNASNEILDKELRIDKLYPIREEDEGCLQREIDCNTKEEKNLTQSETSRAKQTSRR